MFKIKSISFIISVLVMSFLIGYFVFAWQEPQPIGVTPPEGNVSAPLNVSGTAQAKAGGLILNTGGAATGLIVQNGNVGIGTTSPAQRLHSTGYIRADSGFCIGTNCITSWAGLGMPSGSSGQTLRHDGTNWVVNSVIFNNGTNVGIGTTSPRADTKLDVNGAVGTSRMGIGGTYSSTQVQGIWSIAPNYKISTANNDFGTQYGITYAHTNAGTDTAKKPIAGWGHQILFTSSGTRNVAISLTSGHGYFAGNVGIGTTSPAQRLHSTGYIRADSGFCIGTNCITSWPSGAALPTGASGQTLRHTGTDWVANSIIFNNGTNVGINTSSPTYRLDVSGNARVTTYLGVGGAPATNARVYAYSGAAYGVYALGSTMGGRFEDSDGTARTYLAYSNYGIYQNLGTRNYFSGNVGIGTTSPGQKLDVAGNIRATGNNILNNASPTTFYQDSDHRSAMVHVNSNLLYVLRGCGANSLSWCTVGGSWPLVINLENNDATFGRNVHASAFYYTSDERLKENIGPLEGSLSKIIQLNGISYKLKETGEEKIGLSAQEVEKIFPEAVNKDKNGMLSIDSAGLIASLVEAVKEQQKEIEELKEIIENIK